MRRQRMFHLTIELFLKTILRHCLKISLSCINGTMEHICIYDYVRTSSSFILMLITTIDMTDILKITWKYFLQQNLIQTTNKEKSSCLINVHSVQCCSFLWLIIYWSCLDVLYECRLCTTLLYNITYHIKSFYYYASFLHLLQVFTDIRFHIRRWIISVSYLIKMILVRSGVDRT